MNLLLNNKTALITGSSSGLGERAARVLSAAGARVLLAARRIDKLEMLAAELPNTKAIKMDVSDKDSVLTAFTNLEKNNEQIDICVNNAGIVLQTPIFEEDSNDNFEKTIQTNLMGVWYVTQKAANHMKYHGIRGSIINIASVNGANKVRAGLASYAASKAGVIQLTKLLVGELSP